MNETHFIEIDMDGVTVALREHVLEVTGFDMDKLDNDVIRKLFWKDVFTPEWFLHAKPKSDALILVDFCVANFRRVKFLTAIPHSAPHYAIESMTNKIEWNRRNIKHPLPTTFGPFSQDKQKHCLNDKHVLIDDMHSNIAEWGGRGGIAILHENADKTIHELKKLL